MVQSLAPSIGEDEPWTNIANIRSKAYKNGLTNALSGYEVDIPDDAIAMLATKNSQQKIQSIEWKEEYDFGTQIPLYIEIKIKIKTAGELLRQINLYRSVASYGAKIMVVAPSESWDPDVREILKEQGVYTLNYLSD